MSFRDDTVKLLDKLFVAVVCLPLGLAGTLVFTLLHAVGYFSVAWREFWEGCFLPMMRDVDERGLK